MDMDASREASIIISQDGIQGFLSKLLNPQEYEIFLDDQKVGVLTGYVSQKTCSVSPGVHSIYVRAYARNSVSVTRIYGYSLTLEVNVAAGETKHLSCGIVAGPPVRKYLILVGTVIAVLFALGIGPIGDLPERTRYLGAILMAALTMVSSWYGHSAEPGKNIYLREI